MNFGSVIHTAQKNGQTSRKEIQYYSTKFEPPKKEKRSKSLSANIQKFLARREEEERKKNAEERKRREQLLELRSKDKKASRRVSVMLKRTKSANQSVIDDAVDNDNTAVTLAGPSQPDEDDYGYVSQAASDFYNKMMEKYSKMPHEPKFNLEKKKLNGNLNNTKDRVRSALEREKEEAGMPHRRRRREHGKVEEEDEGEKYEPKAPTKPKLKAAPVINFNDLLKIAEKKQHEPIIIEQKKEKDDERPLTKKQKRELEKERDYIRDRRERERNPSKVTPNSSKESSTAAAAAAASSTKPSQSSSTSTAISQKQPLAKVNSENKVPKATTNGIHKQLDRRELLNNRTNLKQINNQTPGHSKLNSNCDNKMQKSTQQQLVVRKLPTDKPKISNNSNVKLGDKNSRAMPPPSSVSRFENNKPKEFPPRDVQRQFPQKRKPLVNKGRFYDDDEDYDSEMDDFIDDAPEEGEDYSKYISEIFGYDKKRYRNLDDDVDDMETSFAQQMREEVISTKIGIMEDLEDMKKEEEEKRRKLMMRKKHK